jgi:hypothetical protein
LGVAVRRLLDFLVLAMLGWLVRRCTEFGGGKAILLTEVVQNRLTSVVKKTNFVATFRRREPGSALRNS